MAKQALRPVRIEGNIAYVTLSQGREAIIDAADAGAVGQFNWRVQSAGENHKYAGRSEMQNGQLRAVLMHRFICNPDDGQYVDHINGNGLDNRRLNLRVCTQSQNLCNKSMQSNNSSGYKGVHLHAPGKWRARISFRGAQTELGVFPTPEEAHHAYVAAARRLHGEFMRAS